MTAQVQAPILPYVIKPNLKQYFGKIGLWRVILSLGITLILYFRFGMLAWVLSVVAIVAIVACVLFFSTHRRMTLTASGIEYKPPFGRALSVAYGEIETVKVFVNFMEPSFGTMPRVSIGMHADTAAPIILSGMYWPPESLEKLLIVLNDKGVIVESSTDVVTIKQVSTQFPKYATYGERHTVLLATLITIGIVVVIAVFATIVALGR